MLSLLLLLVTLYSQILYFTLVHFLNELLDEHIKNEKYYYKNT